MHRQSEIARLRPVETVDQISVKAYFQTLSEVIPHLPYASIEQIAATITNAANEGHTIFVLGNGGSAATASHVVCDLGKTTIHNAQSRRLKVIALTDNVPMMTA